MLLKKIGLDFQLIEPTSEETVEENLSAEEYTKKIAVQKAYSVLDDIKEGVIIAADTVVVKDSEILGKPKDKKDALRMLTKLNGTSHFVFTAVVVLDKKSEKLEVAVEKTKVEMRQISERELQMYIESGEPLDAAGAYKIQEKGAKFIKRIEGCYYNVVGLPIATLVEILKRFDIEV